MTTERTHLSIGEVLSLLQDEFPDVTISKIRFLESQGLLDPERTPSGYRKFYDDDIERLRWILPQQRDHFLPLKVIKDRLASGDLGGGTPEGVLPLAADTAEVKDPTTVPAWASTTPAPAAASTNGADSAEVPEPVAAAKVPAASVTAPAASAEPKASSKAVPARRPRPRARGRRLRQRRRSRHDCSHHDRSRGCGRRRPRPGRGRGPPRRGSRGPRARARAGGRDG